MGSEARDGRGPLARTTDLANTQTTPPYLIPHEGEPGGFNERCFSYAGVIAVAESPPWEPPFPMVLLRAVCRLSGTGTDTTTISINVNGVSVATGDMAASIGRIEIPLGVRVTTTDVVSAEVTVAGNLAEQLTVHVRT